MALYSVSSQRMVLSIPIQLPLPPNCSSASEICWNAKGLIIFQVSPKHKETQAMSIYLGIHKIALFWIWTVSEDIFGWTYLYLYLDLDWCICICICIWINVEQNICICICIWKIQIFVFVFVFVFDKTYLTPALLQGDPGEAIWFWPQCAKGGIWGG